MEVRRWSAGESVGVSEAGRGGRVVVVVTVAVDVVVVEREGEGRVLVCGVERERIWCENGG